MVQLYPQNFLTRTVAVGLKTTNKHIYVETPHRDLQVKIR